MNENPSKSSAAGGGSRPEITTRLSPAPAAGEFTQFYISTYATLNKLLAAFIYNLLCNGINNNNNTKIYKMRIIIELSLRCR